jgi:uncharacterized protein with NAD-binding domain and iron-sulfur cluster
MLEEGMSNEGRGRDAGVERVRVAIVGGGIAGLTTAWELSERNREEGAQRFEITVYEASWALGGKGASYRDRDGRILEHGLHVWLGFYENAFGLMRACYRELQLSKHKAGPFDEVGKAFFPEHHLTAAMKSPEAQWLAWSGMFPPAPGEPGTPLDGQSNPFTLPSYVARMLNLLKTLMVSVIAPASGQPDPPMRPTWGTRDTCAPLVGGPAAQPELRSPLDDELAHADADSPTASAEVLFQRLATLVRLGALTTAAGLLQAMSLLEAILDDLSSASSERFPFIDIVEAVVRNARRLLADLVKLDEQVRRRTEIIDLLMTIVVRLFRDKVLATARAAPEPFAGPT